MARRKKKSNAAKGGTTQDSDEGLLWTRPAYLVALEPQKHSKRKKKKPNPARMRRLTKI